jgi:hypothetical protein
VVIADRMVSADWLANIKPQHRSITSAAAIDDGGSSASRESVARTTILIPALMIAQHDDDAICSNGRTQRLHKSGLKPLTTPQTRRIHCQV